MSHLLTSDRLTRVIFDFSRVVDGKKNKKQVTFDFDGKRQVSVDFENKPMVLYLIFIIYTIYKDGFPAQEETGRKRKELPSHEKMFSVLYNSVTGNDTKLYNSKGILGPEITRLNNLLHEKEIPQDYCPSKKDCVFRIPYITKDMVYFKFRHEEFAFYNKIETLMEKQSKKDFERALIDLFR